MKHFDDHVELKEEEARQATEIPPTQYVLGISLTAVIAAFVLLSFYWWYY